MADKLPQKVEGDAILSAHNLIRLMISRGNIIPFLSLSEIETARADEIADGRDYYGLVYNTTRGVYEIWSNTGTGKPLLGP